VTQDAKASQVLKSAWEDQLLNWIESDGDFCHSQNACIWRDL